MPVARATASRPPDMEGLRSIRLTGLSFPAIQIEDTHSVYLFTS
jgi:hypothetical protein